jgi:hypothetical protein
MAVSLKRALMEILTDWPDDLPPEWRDACGEVELGFGNADPQPGSSRFHRHWRWVRGLRARQPPFVDPDNKALLLEAVLARDVMIMNPARFSPVVAMTQA